MEMVGDAPTHESGLFKRTVARVRFLLGAALVLGLLYFVVGGLVLPRGLQRPPVVTAAPLAALLAAVCTIGGAYVAVWVAGSRTTPTALMVVGLALVVWAFPGGTIDDWLKLRNVTASQSAGPAYWALLPEHVYWFMVSLGVLVAAQFAERPDGGAVRRALGLDRLRAELARGVFSSLICAGAVGVCLSVLNVPAVSDTRRQQVYFALAVGFALALGLCRYALPGRRHVVWYLLSPLVVGLVGVVSAGAAPRLAGAYGGINVIPVSGLVRALPVELTGMALLFIGWSASVARPPSEASGAT
ncbi:MAG: hypothetical protein CHACPFDD_02410 [Phycisphaerae bacterium]|nr:hypothetical protein [Phycisphaerae bacterium]